eukprot:5137009-Alexandrium_andersonii.AAC.1
MLPGAVAKRLRHQRSQCLLEVSRKAVGPRRGSARTCSKPFETAEHGLQRGCALAVVHSALAE